MGSQGNNPQKVLALGEKEWLDCVHWSPDSRRLAYLRGRQRSSGGDSGGAAIETCDLTGAPDGDCFGSRGIAGRLLLALGAADRYSRQESPGSSDDNLWQIGIDGQVGTPTGKPKRLTQWAGSFLGNLCASADGKRLTLEKTT